MNPPAKIIINGKEYSSLSEVPEQFRKFLADENQNGVPDAMENIFKLAFSSLKNPGQPMVIDARGQDFLDRIPPEARQEVLKSIEQLKALKQGGEPLTPAATASFTATSVSPTTSTPLDYDRLYRDLTQPQDRSRSYLIWAVLVGLAVVLGVLGLAAYFLMPQ